MLTLRERYRGTLVGVLAGDSLGAPYEKRDPVDIAVDLDRRGGLMPFDYEDPWGRSGTFPAGRPTDDSELTAALAQSLIECNGSNPSHQYDLFRRTVNGESFLWDGEANEFSEATRRMLLADDYKEALLRDNQPRAPSNGSLMRSAPLSLFYHNRSAFLLQAAAKASSAVTHINETAIECCSVYVRILDWLLYGYSPKDAWESACERGSNHDAVYLFLTRDLPKPEATNVWLVKGGLAGSALHTLHVAMWSTLYATDFRDGVEKAVRFGGDTDTTGAVAGSMLGAHFGLEGIPAEWRSILKGHDRMIDLADQLHDLASDNSED
jgi:ADP-ribosyl-[dinitrogen reductase] hydrolase